MVATTETSRTASGHVHALALALEAHAHAHGLASFITCSSTHALLYLAMLALTISSYLPKE